jgi:RNA polymerase subunit RPABC4/transcription elongation factor Spt4
MKGWTSGQILGVVGLVLFIAGVAIKAESAADWAIGLGLLAVALLVGWWLTRFDSPSPGSAPTKIATAPQPAAPAAISATLHVCSGCGVRSTGTKFCPECGKPFQLKNACSQCGAQFQAGTKFCPECGTKIV